MRTFKKGVLRQVYRLVIGSFFSKEEVLFTNETDIVFCQ
jgi:hypothetical protein